MQTFLKVSNQRSQLPTYFYIAGQE